MSETSTAVCPYVGLIPFDEKNAEYFFGRENDTKIVATNLRAARLTIFYGASGVGKSSVIKAGVVPALQKLTEISTLPGEPPDFLLVVMRDWASDPIDNLQKRIKEVIDKAVEDKKIPLVIKTDVEQIALRTKTTRNLSEILENWTRLIGTKLLIILDQFEDFFLHPEFGTGENSFGEQFPKAINRVDLPVNFMISLRDDALAKLDFFKGKIQEPMSNTLRLRHLNREQAEEAIREPLKIYNREETASFAIEDVLVEKVLEDVQVGKIKFGTQGQAEVRQVESSSESEVGNSQIEAPFLQLVMKKLWNSDITQTEKVLTMNTLVNEGDVQKIVETHLDGVMKQFNDADRDLAAEFIHFTVTRSGAKIISDAANLAEWAKIPKRKNDIDSILEKLSEGDTRIYKIVPNLNDQKTNYYEVSHDALAPAILNWRSRYAEIKNRQLAQKSLKKAQLRLFLWSGVASLILISVGFAVYQWLDSKKVRLEKDKLEEEQKVNEFEQYKAQIASAAASREKTNLENLLVALTDLTGEAEGKNEAQENFKFLLASGNLSQEMQQRLESLIKKIGKNDDQTKEILKIFDEKKQTTSPILTPTPTPTPTPEPNENISPRVYIHILSEEQRNPARVIQSSLKSDFLVPGIENVGSRNLKNTQVRYFRRKDKDEADKVVNILKGSMKNKNVVAQYNPGYENSTAMRPKHLEIWFAADAFPETVSTTAK